MLHFGDKVDLATGTLGVKMNKKRRDAISSITNKRTGRPINEPAVEGVSTGGPLTGKSTTDVPNDHFKCNLCGLDFETDGGLSIVCPGCRATREYLTDTTEWDGGSVASKGTGAAYICLLCGHKYSEVEDIDNVRHCPSCGASLFDVEFVGTREEAEADMKELAADGGSDGTYEKESMESPCDNVWPNNYDDCKGSECEGCSNHGASGEGCKGCELEGVYPTAATEPFTACLATGLKAWRGCATIPKREELPEGDYSRDGYTSAGYKVAADGVGAVDGPPPSHYLLIPEKNVQSMDIEKAILERMEGQVSNMEAAYLFNIIKYVTRLGAKDAILKEVRKIAHYSELFIKSTQGEI